MEKGVGNCRVEGSPLPPLPRNPRVGGIGGADVEVQLISRGVKREGKREREGVIRWRVRGMSQGLR